MNAWLYIVRDRVTRLAYLTGARPQRREGGVEFVGLAARLLERNGVDRVDAIDVWPTLRSLLGSDVEFFEVQPSWSVDHDVRRELLKAAETSGTLRAAA